MKDFRHEKSVIHRKAEVSIYTHVIHKCQLIHYPSDDNKHFFSICFKAIPLDQKGCQHALEHMAFNGSKKYPFPDVFFEMDKRSVNTFTNAITSDDRTTFLFSTTNEIDFHNLMDVYLDAIFNPLLTEEQFQREVFRREFSEPNNINSNLINMGVLYNEMKTDSESASSVFIEELENSILSDTNYAYSAQGVPRYIARMTVENIREIHKKYYGPSNCFFFFYGSFNLLKVLVHINQFLDPIPYSTPFTDYNLIQPSFLPKRLNAMVQLINLQKQNLNSGLQYLGFLVRMMIFNPYLITKF
jgi:Zn-dependent M16 (insulinase) family peptidase